MPPPPTNGQQAPPPRLAPCEYKTGKTLGQGSYATVKEATHIKDGKKYACKVISKKLMRGKEYMILNEIDILKKMSKGHHNVITLWDYFETPNNLYLVMDLCTGGELFDRICELGCFYETNAAQVVRTVTDAVAYLHEHNIVHRDIKAENLLFRSKDSDELVLADFGLSRLLGDNNFEALKTMCGTPGYMAPEVIRKTGHGKAVDMWSIGVLTYFLLCGYTPFDAPSHSEEVQKILANAFTFTPQEFWADVSEHAKDFVQKLLVVDPHGRMTATQALKHPWLASLPPMTGRNGIVHESMDQIEAAQDKGVLLPTTNQPEPGATNLVPKMMDAKKRFRKVVDAVLFAARISHASQESLASNHTVNSQDDRPASTSSEPLHPQEDPIVNGQLYVLAR
ncbi:hypothetical protein SeMB42_g00064 [Synchytrium endobioticum]|uniref:Protein kinase domain-containing protein n=1 Tax=Synchytrium endobioticum TaxID=286115 RepID=A0A507D3D0_9FUNG|nr:hypothetical protein SeLEV6574_g03535 [Synchytrium endobioticum]TPX55021.1 hypothetical protein SeMB42_g00064 [Synchytrium endobioticum]